jgi:hypothetical protein
MARQEDLDWEWRRRQRLQNRGGQYSGGMGSAASGAMSGAAAGGQIGGIPGALIGGALGGIGGLFEHSEAKNRQQGLEKSRWMRQRQNEEIAKRLYDQASSGSQQMLQGRIQEIERRFGQKGRAGLRDAARRGLVHSGYAKSMGRDMERERQGALTQAHGEAQDFLLRALMGGAGVEQKGMLFDMEMEGMLAKLSAQERAELNAALQDLLEEMEQGGYELGRGGGGGGGGGVPEPQTYRV